MMKKTPPFLTGILLLFWGMQADTLWIAALLAAVIESRLWIHTRFKLSWSDANKFVDISIMLLAGTVVAALTIDADKSLQILLRWLPAILFPIIGAQVYSSEDALDIRSFFLAARKKKKHLSPPPRQINIFYLYALLVLLSAGSSSRDDFTFFIGLVLFSSWILWLKRSRRYPLIFWLAAVLIMAVLGFGIQKVVHSAGIQVTRWAIQRYADYYSVNPFKTRIAMGELGELKLSDRIILRISMTDAASVKPFLLHDTTFNKYLSPNWFSSSQFTRLTPHSDKTTWPVNTFPDNLDIQTMTLYRRPVKNRAVLSLPAGTVRISQMKAGQCEKNRFQSVRIADVPDLIKADISYSDKLTFESAPNQTDLFIPKNEQDSTRKFIQMLNLSGLSDVQILSRVKKHFLTQYTYSLDLQDQGAQKSAMDNFLFHTRSGHCEFFATAAALVLRQAGIPARYATGFIVHEYSGLEKKFIVRQRDAHAWTKVFVNNHWVDFDTTPPSFLRIDSETVRPSKFFDLMSYLGFELSRLRHYTGKQVMEKYGLWLILPLGLILIFRLKKKGDITQVSQVGSDQNRTLEKDTEDLFAPVEACLSSSGLSRHTFETRRSWHRRIAPRLKLDHQEDQFETLVLASYQSRFSKTGLTQKEKSKLKTDIQTFLTALKQNNMGSTPNSKQFTNPH